MGNTSKKDKSIAISSLDEILQYEIGQSAKLTKKVVYKEECLYFAHIIILFFSSLTNKLDPGLFKFHELLSIFSINPQFQRIMEHC